MPQNNVTERRRFARVAIETQISFTTANQQDNRPHTGTTQNLSAGGIYITTEHQAKLGEHIRIVINQSIGTHLIAEGIVVRCKFDKKTSNLFHISIEFSETQEYLMQSITNNEVMVANKYG